MPHSLPLGALIQQLVPSLPAEQRSDLLLDRLAQHIADAHYDLMRDEPAPVLIDPMSTPLALRARYRCVAQQALTLAEYGALNPEDL